ncbi:MAG TPA: type II toxin-antitoxin system Phd/YefM family antitoxin [Polyangiaceae bacterium]
MAKRYSIADARKNLPSLVDEAQTGTNVELTRRGRPVAVLVGLDEYERLTEKRRSFSQAYATFRRQFPAGRNGLEPKYFERLRDRSPGRKIDL